MQIEQFPIAGVLKVTPPRFGDSRGFFSETFHASRFADAGIPGPFVQDNHSMSVQRGVVRGLHCQLAPSAQGKLVRVLRGAIWDVAVDIRHGSPTFGQHVAVELTSDNWAQFWVPAGFLHGFCTLLPDTEVLYKTTAPYAPVLECGVLWNDPALQIPWPINQSEAVLSEKDKILPRLADCPVWFTQ